MPQYFNGYQTLIYYGAGTTLNPFVVLPHTYIIPDQVPTTVPTQAASGPSTAAAAHLQITFDTWGKNIFLLYGAVKVAGATIWAQGIEGGDQTVVDGATSLSWAESFGYPLDIDEEVYLSRIEFDGNKVWDAKLTPQAQIDGLNFRVYYGTEQQNPDPLIVADKGANRTPGFRGERYIVFDSIPLQSMAGRKPNVFAEFKRVYEDRITIEDIILKLAARSGLDVVVEGIDDEADGVVIARDTTFQQWCQDHMRAYNFYIIDSNPIKIVRRAIGNDLRINWFVNAEECLSQNPDEDVIRKGRQEVTEIPNQIEIRYADLAIDYQLNTQYARRPLYPVSRTNSKGITQIEVNPFITATEALGLAYDTLYRGWSELSSFGFKLPSKYIGMRPGDIIQITEDEAVFTVRASNVTIGSDNSIEVAAPLMLVDPVGNFAADPGDILSNTLFRRRRQFSNVDLLLAPLSMSGELHIEEGGNTGSAVIISGGTG